ncbi:hypothetical protein ACIA8K_20130 [Catenuloplanes sp. NPDC051500]|uniref:hypothetical protein n=1 Tax=Catenuloplanes sp. NPDC051500 TaxID=3363959 RepID=UPI0037AC0E5B
MYVWVAATLAVASCGFMVVSLVTLRAVRRERALLAATRAVVATSEASEDPSYAGAGLMADENVATGAMLGTILEADVAALNARLSAARTGVADLGAKAELDRVADKLREATTEAHLWRTVPEGREHLTAATGALASAGRHLSRAAALSIGRPAPEDAPPCLFDPAHGPASREVEWAPNRSAPPRRIPVCEADHARVAAGRSGAIRSVIGPRGQQPYYDTPGYGDWLLGYFDGYDPYQVARLLDGTVLGRQLPGRITGRTRSAGGSSGEFGTVHFA